MAKTKNGKIIIGLEELLVVGRLLTAFLVSFLASFLASFVFFVHDGHADWWPLSVILAIAIVWYNLPEHSEDEDELHGLITEMLRLFLVWFLTEFVFIVYVGHAKWWPLLVILNITVAWYSFSDLFLVQVAMEFSCSKSVLASILASMVVNCVCRKTSDWWPLSVILAIAIAWDYFSDGLWFWKKNTIVRHYWLAKILATEAQNED